MSGITGVRASWMSTESQTDSISTSYTYNFASGYAWGQSTLQTLNHGNQTNSHAADTYVCQYVQAGVPNNGYWPLVSGPNFTSISFMLSVNDCAARAVWVTEFFG